MFRIRAPDLIQNIAATVAVATDAELSARLILSDDAVPGASCGPSTRIALGPASPRSYFASGGRLQQTRESGPSCRACPCRLAGRINRFPGLLGGAEGQFLAGAAWGCKSVLKNALGFLLAISLPTSSMCSMPHDSFPLRSGTLLLPARSVAAKSAVTLSVMGIGQNAPLASHIRQHTPSS